MSNKNDSLIEDLFRMYYEQLCMYCMHYVRDMSQAEDIVMDGFLKLDETLKNGAEIVSLKSYIYSVCRNKCIDVVRKKSMVNTIYEIPEFITDDENLQEQCACEVRMWKALDSLPPACRNVFLMSKRDGMKYKEIALVLGISVKTVEAQITKAYKILRGKAKLIYTFLFL